MWCQLFGVRSLMRNVPVRPSVAEQALLTAWACIDTVAIRRPRRAACRVAETGSELDSKLRAKKPICGGKR
jgi:hypothetical protein